MQLIDNPNLVTETLVIAKAFTRKGLLQEVDDLLSDAVQNKQVGVLDVFEWVKIASTLCEHKVAQERLQRAKASSKTVNWLKLEAQTLLLARQFRQLASILQVHAQGGPNVEWAQQQLTYVNSLINVDEHFAACQAGNPDFPAYCINLDEDVQKWKRCQVQAASANLQLARVPGVRGGHLPDGVLGRLGRNVSHKFKGTLGCFLGHFRAWEVFLESNEPFALILEDDYRAIVRFPSPISTFNLPDDFDVCWINRRMETDAAGPFRFIPIRETTYKRASPEWRGCGNEGYILSRRGASKLIDQVSEDGFLGDVDWRMVTYSLERRDIMGLSEQHFARMAMAVHLEAIAARAPLVSFTSSIGLIGLTQTGSSREAQNIGRHFHESFNDTGNPF